MINMYETEKCLITGLTKPGTSLPVLTSSFFWWKIREVVKVEASWPPKKPESYFRTLRRLLDLLACWGEKGGAGKVAEIICKVFRGTKIRHLHWQLYVVATVCKRLCSIPLRQCHHFSVFVIYNFKMMTVHLFWGCHSLTSRKTIQAAGDAKRRQVDPKLSTAGPMMLGMGCKPTWTRESDGSQTNWEGHTAHHMQGWS